MEEAIETMIDELRDLIEDHERMEWLSKNCSLFGIEPQYRVVGILDDGSVGTDYEQTDIRGLIDHHMEEEDA
jgi:hypothetical protein